MFYLMRPKDYISEEQNFGTPLSGMHLHAKQSVQDYHANNLVLIECYLLLRHVCLICYHYVLTHYFEHLLLKY